MTDATTLTGAEYCSFVHHQKCSAERQWLIESLKNNQKEGVKLF